MVEIEDKKDDQNMSDSGNDEDHESGLNSEDKENLQTVKNGLFFCLSQKADLKHIFACTGKRINHQMWKFDRKQVMLRLQWKLGKRFYKKVRMRKNHVESLKIRI